MALTNQIHIHSVDTSAFYTDREKKISEPLGILYSKRSEIKKIKPKNRSDHEKRIYKLINKRINAIKCNLKCEFENNEDVRELDDVKLNDMSIVSVFESTLTRVSDFEINEITRDIIIVKTFFYKILKDITENGFILNGEKYRIFTASAGQIRTKKTVFIKESVWNKHKSTLTCGMSIDKINSKGGMNVNKYLAYLALTNSATDLWEDFDIDKCIVVDDFETEIFTKVDFIDRDTYKIDEQVDMNVPIPHMDGCGIMLPKVSRKSFMVRAPWVKGLLVPFNFLVFIKENLEKYPNCNKIKDIYGKDYDIIKDDIQVIFTKSQFKLYKYYESWDEYKYLFKKHNCEAGKCNEEPDRRKNAKINYQMMQTLSDITDDELTIVTQKLRNDIENLATDRNTMLKVLGVTEYNTEKNYLQKALEIYPEMLQDTYCRKILGEVKRKLINEGRSARLPIKAKYTFLIPDLYAFSEWLFLGDMNPKGLLKDGEVYCKLFKNVDKVDVLRSPHLFLEHAIRTVTATQQIKRWFITDGIYTSVFDPISKILQFDNDGDQALVCAEETIINVAERNISKYKVVPLYYEMSKADSQELDEFTLYNGMINAYSGGNIGLYSNDICKIWNNGEVNKDAINTIKYLCMENNFVIDYAKTLYKPERPDEIDSVIKGFTKKKTPAFFTYAKGKEKHQVEDINYSPVNRLKNIVKDRRLKFDVKSLGEFDYKMLMSDNSIDIDEGVVKTFVSWNRKISYINLKEYQVDANDELYIWKIVKNEILKINPDVDYVTNVLVKHLYEKNSQSKMTLWECFGDVIYNNLDNNIQNKIGKSFIMCEICGDRIKKTNNKTKYCSDCAKIIKLNKDRELQKNKYNSRK